MTVDDTKMTIWADNATELPVHIVAEPLEGGSFHTVDLEYDLPMEADMFTMEPPPDYKVMRIQIDSLPEE